MQALAVQGVHARLPRHLLIAVLAASAAVPAASASVTPATFAPFALVDHEGVRHDLREYEGSDAVVLMVQGNGCPLVRNAQHDLRAVRERFADADVVFLMLNANPQDDAESIRAEAREWGLDLPVLVDETQAVGRALGLTRTAEVLVLTPAWQVAYRGPVNDRITYEHQRPRADKHYLADALTAVLAGRAPPLAQVEAPGCLINFSHGEDPPTVRSGHRGKHKAHHHAP